MWAKIRHKLRNIFLAGLLALLPIYLTYLVLMFLFTRLDRIAQPLVHKMLGFVSYPAQEIGNIPGLGVAATILVIFFVGLVVTNMLGRRLMGLAEKILHKIPLVSNVYGASKQFFEAISISSKEAFSKVVLIEYPRKGIYTIGFVTSNSKGEPQLVTQEEVVNVFIPTTPNPTSGFLIMVPKEQLIPLSMSVEEGIKLVVSGGIISPPLPPHLKEGP